MHSPLLTDLYQITMAQGYWTHGMADREAVFHLFFRRAPFGDRAAIAVGLGPAVDYLTKLSFTDEEIDYLQTLRGADGKALFAPGYLAYLQDLDWKLEVHGIPEGELVFPHEPLLRICGPLLQCQLVETALLNIVNFQTLVATKAARIDIWGVGTKLVTAYDQPALGGVYKLGAIRDAEGTWQYRVKLSNDLIKVSHPGILQIARRRDTDGTITSDRLFNEGDEPDVTANPDNLLLKPVLRSGKPVEEPEAIEDIRARALDTWPKRPAKGKELLSLDHSLERTKRDLLTKNGFPP